jgi:uncharacterized protein YycO
MIPRNSLRKISLITALTAFLIVPAGAAKKTPDKKPQQDQTFEQIKLLLDVYQQVTQNYVEDVDSKEYLKIVKDFENDLLNVDDLKHEKGQMIDKTMPIHASNVRKI